jgi:hypothetical protein
MIIIHSDGPWFKSFVPRFFKIRVSDHLDSVSRGTIAARAFWDTPADALKQIQSLSGRYQYVILYVCEPWQDDFLPDLLASVPNNVMVFSDVIWDTEPANHQYVGNWFMTHHNLYTESDYCQHRLSQLQHDLEQKPYRFDALLGVSRPHRELVYQWWLHSAYRNHILLTFHRQDSSKGIWHEPHVLARTELNHEVDNNSLLLTTAWTYPPPGDGGGDRIGTQHIVPVKIYNDAWFSIITEGFTDAHGTRLTEKTAKAFVAQRFFVYFGAANDLARMRQLGFQTFGDIVDESYDSIPDDRERWYRAWRTVEWVCQQDAVQLLRATHAVRLHNQQVFLETDWYANLRHHVLELCAK